uniref:RING-type domain-containing protein n=1 Tax=Globodera rostochiensis TaxID=31243 RepID=A0A914HVE7_GLORO
MCRQTTTTICAYTKFSSIHKNFQHSPSHITKMKNAMVSWDLKVSHVEILERAQLGGHRPVVRCDATGANFGQDIVEFSFEMRSIGCAFPTEPFDSCGNVTRPEMNTTAHCLFDFAVVPRGNCTFSEKAFFAQTAKPTGYSALIVFSAKGQNPIPMSGSKYAEKVKIPVVMVNYACMQSLLYGQYTTRHGYLVTVKASPGYYDLIKYLIPFVAIVGICFVVLFISLMIRLCRERRRQARKRLPRSHLKKIPTKKYKKGDPEETCAICLEDFQESEKLRVLPCRHAYHCKCIDPWLTKNRKVCPVCKRRVGPRNSDSSDTDDTDAERLRSASSNAGTAPTSSASAVGVAALLSSRDNDPLLRNAQPMATTSGTECPYPQNAIPSLVTTTGGTFMRATNFVNFGSIFQRRGITSTASGSVGTAPNVRQNTESLDAAHQQDEMLNASQMSSALEDLTNVGVQSATSSTNAASPFQLVRSSLVGMRDKLTNLIRHQKSDGSNPHTLLENEDDASTLAREEAADTLSRQTCETFDDTNGSSNDGHSMTTMHSNRQLNAVAVDLSCAVASSPPPPPSDGVNEFQSTPEATADEQQQQQQQQLLNLSSRLSSSDEQHFQFIVCFY